MVIKVIKQMFQKVIQQNDFNNIIIKEGEEGDKFYMVAEGTLIAYREVDGQQVEVLKYKAGDYFGELALINNVPRQAIDNSFDYLLILLKLKLIVMQSISIIIPSLDYWDLLLIYLEGMQKHIKSSFKIEKPHLFPQILKIYIYNYYIFQNQTLHVTSLIFCYPFSIGTSCLSKNQLKSCQSILNLKLYLLSRSHLLYTRIMLNCRYVINQFCLQKQSIHFEYLTTLLKQFQYYRL